MSRSRLVRFPNEAPDALAAELAEGGMVPADARWLARRCWGCPGLARGLADMRLHEFNRELVERLGRLALEDNFELSDWLIGLAREGKKAGPEARDALQELLECVVVYYRDLALEAAGQRAELRMDQADLALEALERIGANANRQLALDNLFTALALRQPFD